MRKYILAICILVIVIVVLIFIQHQAQTALREQNDLLRAQLEQIQNNNTLLSNSLTHAQSPQSLPDQSRELARLRNEVGMLRQRTNQPDKPEEENDQPQSRPAAGGDTAEQVTAEDLYDIKHLRTVNALRYIELANKVYAVDNLDRFATNFDQLVDELGSKTNFGHGVTIDSFEFVNAGQVTDAMPEMILFREKKPRQTLDGSWVRAYGLVDGNVQETSSPDGNFDEYEKAHSPQPPAQ